MAEKLAIRPDNTPNDIQISPPAGSQTYQKGWAEGCESGLHSLSYLLREEHRRFQSIKDPVLATNVVYSRVWKDAYDFCSFSLLTLIKYHQGR